MKKWLVLLAVLLLLLVGYIAAGPYLTINAIRDAVQSQNSAMLSRQVDFPALRSSLKLQVDNYLVTRAGPDVQSNLFGAIGLRIASGVATGTVDAMVTPAGLAALMGGRTLWNRISVEQARARTYVPPSDPLQDATYGFQSPSRFTATVIDDAGRPVVFVLTRNGLVWKLSDIRLPVDSDEPSQVDPSVR